MSTVQIDNIGTAVRVRGEKYLRTIPVPKAIRLIKQQKAKCDSLIQKINSFVGVVVPSVIFYQDHLFFRDDNKYVPKALIPKNNNKLYIE